jgi:AraC-like DNA-binding protein
LPESLDKSVFTLGDHTREWIVRRQDCRAFDRHGIAIAGISEAHAPYRIVRPRLYHQEVQVCSAGFGRVRVGNRWVKLGPRKACLSPLDALQAFHAVPGVKWQFAWVHYLPGATFLASSRRVEVVAADPAPLAAAIHAIRHEVARHAEPAVLTLLTEWLHLEALRVARRKPPDERLQRTFLAVDARLGHPWTLSEVARIAGLSTEHLRRVCYAEFKQSPMERVRSLRMMRAAMMLGQTTKKVETIALEVGYSSLQAFSSAFKATYGRAPTHYR